MEKKNGNCRQKPIDVGTHYNKNGRFITSKRTNKLKENEVNHILNDIYQEAHSWYSHLYLILCKIIL